MDVIIVMGSVIEGCIIVVVIFFVCYMYNMFVLGRGIEYKVVSFCYISCYIRVGFIVVILCNFVMCVGGLC